MKRYVSMSIEPERIIGKLLRALVTGQTVNLRIEENPKENIDSRPDYKSFDGISLWIKEE